MQEKENNCFKLLVIVGPSGTGKVNYLFKEGYTHFKINERI